MREYQGGEGGRKEVLKEDERMREEMKDEGE